MKAEDVVQSEIRVEAAKRGILLFRNNSGAMTDATGRTVRFGLGNDSAQLNRRIKSSDLIGLDPRAPNGRGGKFLCVECKEEGWRFPDEWRNSTPDQEQNRWPDRKPAAERILAQWRFLTVIHNAGGLAGFAQSVADFERILTGELVLP